ncbi:phosphatase PAP2 family protein [Chishuiella changwenlii]|nr:phosphatase PAP2 family protein [Chishuiella changwenlii]
MNKSIMENYTKLSLVPILPPLFLLLSIVVYLYTKDAFSIEKYIEVQKELFLFLNLKLSQFPMIQHNLTQLGDAFVFLSLLTIFIIHAPKIWEALVCASLVSVVFCSISKKVFSVPRPAVILDNNSFVIVGKTLSGHNSLPSGHSMTVFTILTILLFAFMPSEKYKKIIWTISVLIIGLVLVFTRVGVGAHYPLDVMVGSIIGYISGLLGIFICRKYSLCQWIGNKKIYPFFILLFTVSIVLLINKILKENLVIYYFPLGILFVTVYLMIRVYVRKRV